MKNTKNTAVASKVTEVAPRATTPEPTTPKLAELPKVAPGTVQGPMTIEKSLQMACAQLKRDDIELCVIYSVKVGARYAIRLGQDRWVKDINPLEALDMITKEAKAAAVDAQTIEKEMEDCRAKLELYESLTNWRVNRPETTIPERGNEGQRRWEDAKAKR